MTQPYSEDLRERALARYEAGETIRAIGQALAISPSCISKWRKLKQETGALAPGQIGGHKKPVLSGAMGTYDMSQAADGKNGENLVLIQDRRVAASYMIEAARLIDHYQFRVLIRARKRRGEPLKLRKPPGPGETAWWSEDFTDPRKIEDRKLFS